MVTILLTDNDSLLQKNIKYAFEIMNKDHSVEVSNFENALEFYQHSNPNITIINFDNKELADKSIDEILEADSNACVLALSSTEDPDIREDILKAGANAIVPIPLEYSEKKIDEIMDNLLKVCSVFDNKKCMGCKLHVAN